MKHYVSIYIFIIFFPFISQAQMIFTKVIATCTTIESTGKRHNSFFFTFKVKEVKEGSYNDTIISSDEIYADCGGSQIQSKLGININKLKEDTSYRGAGKSLITSHTNDIIIKLLKEKEEDNYEILWISELNREQDLENLEKLLFSLLIAIETESYTIIEPFLLNKNVMSKKFFRKLLIYTKKNDWDSQKRIKSVQYGLLKEKDGLLYFEYGAYKYVFKIQQKENSKEWLIESAIDRDKKID